MYEISVENDSGTPIVFLDVATFIPGLYEKSDFTEKAAQKTFVIRFNKHYSKIAYKKNNCILVPEIFDEVKMGATCPKPPKEISKKGLIRLIKPTINRWKKEYGMKGSELKIAFHKWVQKRFIIRKEN